MGGSSAAYELSRLGRVILLERETQPGYHSTGRSAATLIESYGNEVVCRLTMASRDFYQNLPKTLGGPAVLGVRGLLVIARDDQLGVLDKEIAGAIGTVERLTAKQAADRHPALAPDYLAAAMFDPSAADLDVHAIQQAYLRSLRERGGQLTTGAEVRSIGRTKGKWVVETSAGPFEAPVLVNAAGAWADEIARLAGIRPIGLQPKRRTAINVEPPEGMTVDQWPMVLDVEEQFYFKPDAGHVLASPADETDSPPTDAQPDELDVALAVDRLERASVIRVRRVLHRWAGLRSFVADHTPVAGAAPDAEGFFWLAAQGGNGIMCAPALAQIIAAAVAAEDLPDNLTRHGLTAAAVAVDRLFA